MPQLTTRDNVHLLSLGSDENRFTLDWLTRMEAALDAIEAQPAPLVAFGEGKFFSNGLDLDWVLAHPDELPAYTARVQAVFTRVLTLGAPTAVAINGHAFGAGAMLAMAFDWRVMREDRGFFCFPEVDIEIPFTVGMAALIQAKLTPRAAVGSMTTGRRFGGLDALSAGIVDGVAAEGALEAAALAHVAPLTGKSSTTLAAIKSTMYADVVRALAQG